MSGFFWLASYPKSGNTWLRFALLCLKEGGGVDFSKRSDFAPVAAGRAGFDLALGIESSDLTPAEILELRPRCYEAQAENLVEPQFRKVHDAWVLTAPGEPLFPPSVTQGSLCIVRDPRDVAVSFAHHSGDEIDKVISHMGNSDAQLARQRDRLFDQLPQVLGSWSDHVAGWLAAPGMRPALLVRYEDMLADPARELRRVADYVGWPATEDAIASAVENTRFDRLRAAEERQGFHERSPVAARFFRKGETGGWRTVLTAAQATRIETAHGDMMRRLRYL